MISHLVLHRSKIMKVRLIPYLISPSGWTRGETSTTGKLPSEIVQQKKLHSTLNANTMSLWRRKKSSVHFLKKNRIPWRVKLVMLKRTKPSTPLFPLKKENILNFRAGKKNDRAQGKEKLYWEWLITESNKSITDRRIWSGDHA